MLRQESIGGEWFIPKFDKYGIDEVFWGKLTEAANGTRVLDADDASRIMKLITEEQLSITETKIVSLIINRLKSEQNLLDEGFLRYLTENYNRFATNDGTPDKELFDTSPPEMKKLEYSVLSETLSTTNRWDFNIFEFEKIAPFPLVSLVTYSLNQYNLIKQLDFDEHKLNSFLLSIIEAYKPLPYHNAIHAADVVQTVYYLLTTGSIKEVVKMNGTAIAAIIVGAAIHDVGHPGVNSKFLITTGHELAIQYNDKSPLENMHLCLAFHILQRKENNFTSRLPSATYREFRRLLVELVLLTDNDMHFALLSRLDRIVTTSKHLLPQGGSPGIESFQPIVNNSPSSTVTDDRQLLLLQITLHTADVSNTAKPWKIYTRWLENIMEEFYLQGDQERDLGVPISYAFDRHNPVNASKFQLGFIKAIVGPLFKTFAKVDGVNLSECLAQLSKNTKVWKQVVKEEEEHKDLLEAPTTPKRLVPEMPDQNRTVSPLIFDSRASGQVSPMIFDEGNEF